ncbi:MAG: DNA replication/repair protein RecF [Oscillospiraceae bacterium]|nr:DNA replication/repair protein RecF [Oscillospiraceae bacterium]
MICKRIECRNFRNIEDAVIEPAEGVTVLCGSNGEGKTNALEAVYLFAQGRSFRTAHDREFVKFGAESAEIKLNFADKNREHDMLIRYLPNGTRMCKRNGVLIRRMSEFIGCFRAVLFCPAHLSIIKDGPSVRRGFLDIAISQLKPFYMLSLQRYNNILTQRNSLIKNYYSAPETFHRTVAIWSEQLAAEAEVISAERAKYVVRLDNFTERIIHDMTGGRETVRLTYNKPRTKDEYVRLLAENPEREIRAGSTLHGTHKDDIEITINDRDARSYASQGQQRSIALAMKLAEGEISREVSGEYPVFLLDDIFSELDAGRRAFMTNGLQGRQVIMTSCDENTEGNMIKVENGKYYAESPLSPAGDIPPLTREGKNELTI